MDEETYKVACFTSRSEQTGMEITTSLWNEMNVSGFPLVTVDTNLGSLRLTIHDLSGLMDSFKSILDKVD